MNTKIKIPSIKLKPLIIGMISGIVFCVIMMSLSSFLFTQSGVILDVVLKPLCLIIISLSSFLSGYVSGRISENNGIVYGAICGFFIFSMIFIGSMITGINEITLNIFLKVILIFLFSISGGVLGVNMS